MPVRTRSEESLAAGPVKRAKVQNEEVDDESSIDEIMAAKFEKDVEIELLKRTLEEVRRLSYQTLTIVPRHSMVYHRKINALEDWKPYCYLHSSSDTMYRT